MVNVLKRAHGWYVLGLVACVMATSTAASAMCGDGIVQSGEQCDSPGSLCCNQTTCQFVASGTSCGVEAECTQFLCNGQGACQNVARPNGTACTDDNVCTLTDQCQSGTCAGSGALNCEDGNICTTDLCDPDAETPAAACIHNENTKPCDDGSFCNGVDVCAGGNCAHPGDPCAGGAECNQKCNEGTDTCFNPSTDDCTSDGNACTDDKCNGAGACVPTHNSAACDDGIFCNGPDNCGGGVCVHAGDPCAAGAVCDRNCNETAEDCLAPAGTTCPDDDNVCTNDACDGEGNCAHPNNTAPCPDDVFCNGADVCAAGVCQHAGDPCANGPECDRTCNETADHCHAATGVTCADDDNVCTDDECDGAGACGHPPNNDPCTDGSFCNGTDSCQGGACTVHAGDPCVNGTACGKTCNEEPDNCLSPAGAACLDDANVCTDDLCDGQGNCGHVDNASPCDDGQFCNGADQCVSGACAHAGDPCADGPACLDTCDETANGCQAPVDSPCVPDTDVCTQDVCDAAGQCIHPPVPPTTVEVAVAEASNTGERFCVNVDLVNCGTSIGAVEGTLRAPSAQFELDPASVTCGQLPDGYTCSAEATSQGVAFQVAPPASDPPTCIAAASGQSLIRLCFRDKAPICSGQDSVALPLAEVQATSCAGSPPAMVASVDGALSCSGLRGDCNADGVLDQADLVTQVDLALQTTAPTAQERTRCDNDCDGDIDVADMRDQAQAIQAGATQPLPCTDPSSVGSGEGARVKVKARSIRLANREVPVRGVQITLTPTGGPVTVTGVRVTKRTKGFNVSYRQADPTGAVRVVVLAPSGKGIKRGVGKIVKLSLARGRPRGRLAIADIRLAE